MPAGRGKALAVQRVANGSVAHHPWAIHHPWAYQIHGHSRPFHPHAGGVRTHIHVAHIISEITVFLYFLFVPLQISTKYFKS